MEADAAVRQPRLLAIDQLDRVGEPGTRPVPYAIAVRARRPAA